MSKGKSVYFHTINGAPAFYREGEQIYYLSRRNARVSVGEFFVADLRTIRKQQKASDAWRASDGAPVSTSRKGYVCIRREPRR